MPGGLIGTVERVVVVGAGMAGLAAANALTHAGVDCIIVEARERLGGRTHTIDFGGLPLDLGGSWIHHPGGNPMARLADQLGLERVSGDFRRDVVFFDPGSGLVSAAETEAVIDLLIRFEDSLDDLVATLGEDADMGTVISHYLDLATPPGRLRRLAARRLRGWVEADSSGRVEEVALAQLASVDGPGYEGDDIGDFIVGGYQRVVSALAEGVEIRSDSPVRSIEYHGDGVWVKGDDFIVQGTHVVVTVPLGVLKSGTIGFDPGLPEDKTTAISRLGFGRFEKVAIRFDRAFWTENGVPHLVPLPLDDDLDVRVVFGMDNAFGDPVVVAFGVGDTDTFMSGPDRVVAERVIRLLEAATGVTAPSPLDVVRTDWAGDPWAMGAYSFIRPGSGLSEVRALGAPVAGRVLFAGEATSLDRPGYADGALSTGIREARRLLGVPVVTLGPISPR